MQGGKKATSGRARTWNGALGPPSLSLASPHLLSKISFAFSAPFCSFTAPRKLSRRRGTPLRPACGKVCTITSHNDRPRSARGPRWRRWPNGRQQPGRQAGRQAGANPTECTASVASRRVIALQGACESPRLLITTASTKQLTHLQYRVRSFSR